MPDDYLGLERTVAHGDDDDDAEVLHNHNSPKMKCR